MVVFNHLPFVAERKSNIQLDLIFGKIGSVAAGSVRSPELDRGNCVLARKFAHIVGNSVFIVLFKGFKAALNLVFQLKTDAAVDYCLTFDDLLIIFKRNVDIGKNLKIRLPPYAASGIFF